MKNIFIISDTHFGHKNILTFIGSDGKNVRSFKDVEEMDETMIQNWNSVVSDNDSIYHLGDVYFGQGYKLLHRLKGKKRLVVGNHDDLKCEHLNTHFQKIMLWRQFKDVLGKRVIMSHLPLHQSSMFDEDAINLHGHIHEKSSPSPKHYNCSVEVQNYRPRHIEDIITEIKRRT